MRRTDLFLWLGKGRRFALLLFVAAFGCFAGCGKKGALQPPPDEPNMNTLEKAYDQFGHKNSKWDKEVRQGFAEMARYRAFQNGSGGGSPEKAAEFFDRAISRGCDDPLALYFSVRFGSKYMAGDPKDWAKAFVTVAQALNASQYHPLRKFYASLRAAEYLQWAHAEWKDVYPMRFQAANQCAAAAKDRSMPFAEVYEACSGLLDCNRDYPELAEKFFRAVEPFLDNNWPQEPELYLLKGRAALEGAWRARGIEFAAKTSEEQWKGFREELEKAEKALTRAWTMDPKNEQVPVYMITLALGQGRRRDPIDGLDQLGGRTNNYQACAEKLTYLEPKWFGSPEELLQFGHECAASAAWGGWVPLILADAHERLSYIFPKAQRSVYWKNPAVWKDIKTAFEKYFAMYPQATDGHERYARFAAWCEQWEEFARQVKLVPSINRGYFVEGGGDFDDYIQAAQKALGRSIW